ncbi:MAG: PP2C family protein-serine/threonine phosphatase [Candidatus Kapabacteria bacterium]|jgi:sigma-B regulation protein RsbU (phosphoserine phosphatase)|nr:PP2C family protein-serine/threonine phosphatase [Candidatus Kapabacteria bacterium]
MNTKSTISINLESLLDLSAKLNESTDSNYILNAALLTLMGKLRVFRAAVLIPDKDKKKFRVEISKGKCKLKELPAFSIQNFRPFDKKETVEKALLDAGYFFGLPVIYEHNLLALICISRPINSKDLRDDEQYYAKLVGTICANALGSAADKTSLILEKKNVEKQNQLLSTLFEINNDFSLLLTREQIVGLLSLHLMGQLMVTRFALFMLTEQGSGSEVSSEIKFEPLVNRFDAELPADKLRLLLRFEQTADISDTEDTDIADFVKEFDLCITSSMNVQGSVKGLLLIGKKMNSDKFEAENIQFIEALGTTAISALENERLFREELDKKRLQSELQTAREIQNNLLPSELPEIVGFDTAGTTIPSRQVGGDYYDFIKLSEHETLVVVADVSGKGMPAALLMANVQAVLRVLAPLRLPLKEIMERLNGIVYQNTTADKFVTAFCGILNSEGKSFEYINAGHNPPIFLKKDGSVEMLKNGGLILGVTDGPIKHNSGLINLKSGDIVLMYTDGVNETPDADNNEFGEDRIMEYLIRDAGQSASSIMHDQIQAVQNFAAGTAQYDDITMAVIKAI